MDLQSVLSQAVTDLNTYSGAAAVVTADQQKLTTDSGTAQAAATTAQASAQAGIAALTAALAQLPAVPAAGTPAAS